MSMELLIHDRLWSPPEIIASAILRLADKRVTVKAVDDSTIAKVPCIQLTVPLESQSEFRLYEKDEPYLTRLWSVFSPDILRRVCGYGDDVQVERGRRHLHSLLHGKSEKQYTAVTYCGCIPSFQPSIMSAELRVYRLDADTRNTPARATVLIELINELQDYIVKVLKKHLECNLQTVDEVHARIQQQDPKYPSSVLVLGDWIPFQYAVYLLEEEGVIETGKLKWVVYQDSRDQRWRVTSLSDAKDKFANRALIPEPLRGLRGPELEVLLGAEPSPGSSEKFFVHPSGFTGGAPTLDLIFAMIQYS